MARLAGYLNDLNGAAVGVAPIPNWQTFTITRPPLDVPVRDDASGRDIGPGTIRRPTRDTFQNWGGRRLGGFTDALNGAGEDWFEKIIAIPRRIDLGNILGTITQTIDLYNSFRTENQDLDSFVNNAGDGVTITDLPLLPTTLLAQRGLTLTLEVTTAGPPSINATLDFVFDTPFTVQIPITGSRVVIVPYRPEAPVNEALQFKTDVFEAKDGEEPQRVALRVAPRQIFDLTWEREEGTERTRIENLFYDWHARIFGLPLWHEPMFTTADAISGATTISVNTTALSDLRVGGLAMIFEDETTFDALQIASITPTSITFESPTSRAFPAGTEIFPLRTAILDEKVRGSRRPKGLATVQGTFRVLDNDPGSSFADASPFPTQDGLVLLDDPNAIESSMREIFERPIVRIDNEVGLPAIRTPQNRDKRVSQKTFVSSSRARLWEIRRLMHFLRGRQKAFYIPTFYNELEVTELLTSGTFSLPIINVGYARFVQSRQLRNIIRLRLFDGTVLVRNVVDAAESTNNTEILTVDLAWPQNIDPSEIEAVDFLELVRMDSDTVRITHQDANGTARVTFPVKGVFS